MGRAPVLRQFDLLAMPSFHEGLPYTLLEAMQSGVPVLASNVGGLAEVIQDGVTGLLAPAGDASALAAAIRRLHGDPALRQALANRAMELASSKFTVDHMARAYLLAYERALGSRHAWPRPAHRPQTRETRTET